MVQENSMNPVVVEIFGYLASAFVAISLLMTAIVKLRVVNLVGSAFFVVYGLLLPETSVPVIITNGFIVIVNLVHLGRLHHKKNSVEEKG